MVHHPVIVGAQGEGCWAVDAVVYADGDKG